MIVMAEPTARAHDTRPIRPPLRNPTEKYPGALLLIEPLGAVRSLLWDALRVIELWAAVPSDHRNSIFPHGTAVRFRADIDACDPPPEIAIAVAYVLDLLEAPGNADPELICCAAGAIADWAAERAAEGTAFAYSIVAADACPASAAASAKVGDIAARFGRTDLMEAWSRRAILLARISGDWAVHAHACLALGRGWLARGYPDRARRALLASARSARRHGVRDVRGHAALHLFRAAASLGQTADAAKYHRIALRAFRQGCPSRVEALDLLADLPPAMPTDLLFSETSAR